MMPSQLLRSSLLYTLKHRVTREAATSWRNASAFVERTFQGREMFDVLILDDAFPWLGSPFRITEFNYLLGHFKSSYVYSDGEAIETFARGSSFRNELHRYSELFPQHRHQVKRFSPYRSFNARVAYTLFLYNAQRFQKLIERYSLPWVISLNPAGGFRLNNPQSDEWLKRVCDSPCLEKIIATQTVTRDYLIERQLIPEQRILLVFGGAYPMKQLIASDHQPQYYSFDKPTLDICFVAMKYSANGADKGYDAFISTAHRVAPQFPQARFHVVGNFEARDIDVSTLGKRITFYGLRSTSFFPQFYRAMDLIVSPNRANVLAQGAFDGFPTGCCMEAGVCGTAVLCTDPLNLNPCFKNEEELLLITPDVQDITEKIASLAADPVRLRNLRQAGATKFREIYDIDRQMKPRIRLFNEIISRRVGDLRQRRSE